MPSGNRAACVGGPHHAFIRERGGVVGCTEKVHMAHNTQDMQHSTAQNTQPATEGEPHGTEAHTQMDDGSKLLLKMDGQHPTKK